MDNRLWQGGAVAAAPAVPAAPSVGYPTNGDPVTASPATIPGAYWFHQIGEEIRAVLAAAGVAPNSANLGQLRDAIISLITTHGGISQADADARYAALTGLATQVFAVAPATTPNQAVNLGQFASAKVANGYQMLPGGLILQWGSTPSIPYLSETLFIFPIAFPTAALFATQIPTILNPVPQTSPVISMLSASSCSGTNSTGVNNTFLTFAIGY